MNTNDPDIKADERARLAVELKPVLRAIATEAEKRLKARMEQGVQFEDLKAVQGYGNRKWKYDTDTTLRKLKELGVGPRKAKQPAQLKTPAQVEKEFGVDISELTYRPETYVRVTKRSAQGEPLEFQKPEDSFIDWSYLE